MYASNRLRSAQWLALAAITASYRSLVGVVLLEIRSVDHVVTGRLKRESLGLVSLRVYGGQLRPL